MSYKGKHCLVVGGGGAIGSNLVRRLLDDGAAVEVWDDFSSGFQWLLPAHPRLRVRLLDISEEFVRPRPPARLIPSGAVVFHLAAHFANANSVEHPMDDLAVNGGGTLRLLQAAAAARVEKLVFASAGCAAGHEDTPYQIHKSLGEAYCRYFRKDVPTAVCRFHNSYGPGEVSGLYRNVIPNWIWLAMSGEPLTVYGDGSDGRDFVYVDDLVSAMLAAEPSPVPYAIGTGVLTRTKDLAESILALTKSSSELISRPRRRWDHPGAACATPIANPLPLAEGLRRTVAWFEGNFDKIKESRRA